MFEYEAWAVSDDLTAFVRHKEKELHDINEYRVEKLEVGVLEKERTIKDVVKKFQALKEDFEFNLALLEARDSEIARLEKNNELLSSNLRATYEEMKSFHKTFELLESKKVESIFHFFLNLFFESSLKSR